MAHQTNLNGFPLARLNLNNRDFAIAIGDDSSIGSLQRLYIDQYDDSTAHQTDATEEELFFVVQPDLLDPNIEETIYKDESNIQYVKPHKRSNSICGHYYEKIELDVQDNRSLLTDN